MEPAAVSDLLVRLAPRVGEFVARLFGVSAEHERQRAAIQRELDEIFVFRTEIVSGLEKHFKGVDARAWDAAAVRSELELLIRCGFPDLAGRPGSGTARRSDGRAVVPRRESGWRGRCG